MKNLVTIIALVAALSIGVMAFADGTGGSGYGPGYGRCGGPYGGGGPGYGGGFGYGGGMWGLADTDEGKAFLKETKALRKKINDLKFSLREAYLAGDDETAETIKEEIRKTIDEIQKIADEKDIDIGPGADRRGRGPGYGKGPRGAGGPGYSGGPGYGGCGGPYCDGPFGSPDTE